MPVAGSIARCFCIPDQKENCSHYQDDDHHFSHGRLPLYAIGVHWIKQKPDRLVVRRAHYFGSNLAVFTPPFRLGTPGWLHVRLTLPRLMRCAHSHGLARAAPSGKPLGDLIHFPIERTAGPAQNVRACDARRARTRNFATIARSLDCGMRNVQPDCAARLSLPHDPEG